MEIIFWTTHGDPKRLSFIHYLLSLFIVLVEIRFWKVVKLILKRGQFWSIILCLIDIVPLRTLESESSISFLCRKEYWIICHIVPFAAENSVEIGWYLIRKKNVDIIGFHKKLDLSQFATRFIFNSPIIL